MKKITKFLDSVMGGIKRTCVAKALAVFAVASVTTSSFAQTLGEANPVINGVEDFVGLTYEEVRNAAVSDNTFPTDDKSKILFFYNVKTGKFINVGGYWGTCVSLHDYGRAMWVNVKGSALHFAMDMNTSVGKYMGYVHTGNNTKDKGVFVDRQEADEVASTAWFIQPVEGDEKNTFKIYTEVSSSTASTTSYDNMYLSANPNYNGANLNCTVYKNPTEGYDEWRIFTYAQIYEKQKDGIVDHMKNALELSFRLKSPGFERGDKDIKNWKTYNFKDKVQNETGFAKFGLEKLYNTTASWGETEETYDVNDLSSGYTFGNDTYNERDNYRRNLGKYYCSSIKEKCGMIYQDISITLPGTYVVECKGYSNTPKAKLFAGVLDPANKDKMVSGTMNYTMFSQTSNMTADEQTRLHISEKNMDYAGKEFYDNSKYVNSVVLTVPESAFYKNGVRLESVNIRLGVMTGEYNADATKVKDAAPGEWTVFDDFRLRYASKNIAQDLVLDEMRADLNYLYNTTNTYENTTLHLNKTLTENKWNSLVLPLSLTKEQLQSTFGANVRLAKLKTLTSTAIEFESVDLNKEALQAYMPYIIFPERTSNASDAYTASLTVDGESEPMKVIVPAGHYTIAKVTMGDLSQINKDDWTTMLYGGDGTIKAYGTFARTFDPDATQNAKDGTWKFSNNKGTIIKGRPNLEFCYFFDKGNMYHSSIKGRVRGLRGFSCWFQPTTTSGAQNAQLTIDGVSQGTTGIEDILADYEQPVSRFANGIYNLNGQLVKQGNSTAGLPSGMYIVNGKKCIVR